MTWGYSACNVISRRVKGVHFAVVGYYMGLVSLILMICYYILLWITTGQFLELHSAETYYYLILALIIDFVSLNAMTVAY